MPINNIKVYTKEEMDVINSKLNIKLENNVIVVQGNRRIHRKTYHDIDKNFSIYLFDLKKAFKFTTSDIENWILINKISNENITLFDVRNVSNLLRLSYMEVNLENIKNDLKKYYKKEID